MLFLILKILIFSMIAGFIGKLFFQDKNESSFEIFSQVFEISFISTGVVTIILILAQFINI